MVWTFQVLDEFLDLIESESWRRLQIPRLHLERFTRRLLCRCKTQPQPVIYDLLEWTTGLPYFLFQQGGNIIVNGKSGSHIMMLSTMAS